MKLFAVFLTLLTALPSAFGNQVTSQFLNINSLRVHYGVYSPIDKIVGDVLFLHGYGDSFSNHQVLFKQLTDSGLRVIGFDYPSHGKTEGQFWNDLNYQSFQSLTQIAHEILKVNSAPPSRPLFIVGWSTGGLHAVRIAQVSSFKTLFPTLSGLVLYAPGVSVKKCVGTGLCQITNDTLNQDTQLQARDIQPKSPLYRIDFATRLLFNAARSWHQGIPEHIPTLLFIGGSKDKYIKTEEVKSWVNTQRSQFASNILAIQCPNAFHELDNELAKYGGKFVREQSSNFIRSLALDKPFLQLTSQRPCHEF